MKSDNWYKLKVLVTPLAWLRVGRTSRAVTSAVQHQLNLGHLPKRIDPFIVRLGALELWGANYPYGFGELKEVNGLLCDSVCRRALPARWMVLKLGALLNSASTEERIKSYLVSKNALATDNVRPSKSMDHGKGL
jgi:hypothetical protein